MTDIINTAVDALSEMSVTMIIAQAISIVGMAVNILSYQLKKQRSIIMMQFAAAALFTVHFFMTGAITGAMLNLVSMGRGLVFSNKKFFHADKIGWVYGFIAAYSTMYVLTFAVFDKPFTLLNVIIELIPVIGTIAFTFGFFLKDAKSVRRLALVNSPCWLFYDIVNVSIGGIICEIISLISIVVGMLRHDRKKQ